MGIRPYQAECIRSILDSREAGVRKQLVSMATGLGKTVVISNLPEHAPIGTQTIVIAHTSELVEQAADKISRWNPHLNIAIDMAGTKADGREDVIVGSVQTLSAREGVRLNKFDPSKACWLVVDEAHHAVASSYRTVIDHFLVNPFTTMVGVTATVNRSDGVAMGSVFDDIVFKYDMLSGISDGWLSDIHGFMLRTGTDISSLSNRDFSNDDKLSAVINNKTRNEAIVKGWIEYLWPRQTIVFTQNIQHAKDLEAAFKRQGIKAAAIWGADPDRRLKLELFRRGEITILINAALLIEGFDMWQVEAVVIATPTKSQSRLIQMVGRGTRLQEGIDNLVEWRNRGLLTDEHKQNVLVMDVVDILGKHSLATLPSLFGLSPKLDLEGSSAVAAIKALQKAAAAHPEADLSRLDAISNLDTFLHQANLWQIRFAEDVKDFSGLQWTKRGDGTYRLLLPKSDYFRIEEDMVGKYRVEGRLRGIEYRQDKMASLSDAVTLVEKTITSKAEDILVLLGREERWMKQPVSKQQMALLKRLRVPEAQIAMLNRGQAQMLINQRIHKKRD